MFIATIKCFVQNVIFHTCQCPLYGIGRLMFAHFMKFEVVKLPIENGQNCCLFNEIGNIMHGLGVTYITVSSLVNESSLSEGIRYTILRPIEKGQEWDMQT